MEWIPAIDLKDGEVVRLSKGLMESAKVYSRDPVAVAKQWRDLGATRLHVVDLDGAFAGTPRNRGAIEKMAALPGNWKIEVGGGIRDRETVKAYRDLGVSYCILGTVAVRDRPTTEALLKEFCRHILLGIDAKDGQVAVSGWAEKTALTAIELARHYAPWKPEAIIYTDISRDGMLSGPNIAAAVQLAEGAKIPVIVSGGVSSLDDLKQIAALRNRGLIGAILGKALYEGNFRLEAALAI